MKKALYVILIIMLSSAIVSCSGGSKTGKTENSAPKVSPPKQAAQPPEVSNKQTPENALRFIVMADCRGLNSGINLQAVTKTLESIKKLQPQPQFAVMPGDLIEGGSVKEELQYFKDTITKYYPIDFFYPGFGNHEATAGESGEKAFREVFSEFKANFLEGYNKTVYYFDKNNIRFYMLNSDHPGENEMISDKQLSWINANSDPNKGRNLYFFHEPAYPTGAHVGSSLDVNKLQRDKLWKIIDSSKNPMAFCGHEHNYTRRHINSDFNERVDSENFNFTKTVYQVTTGTFGAPFYSGYRDHRDVDVPPITEYHYAVVDVTESRILVSVYNIDGKIIDSFQQ